MPSRGGLRVSVCLPFFVVASTLLVSLLANPIVRENSCFVTAEAKCSTGFVLISFVRRCRLLLWGAFLHLVQAHADAAYLQ